MKKTLFLIYLFISEKVMKLLLFIVSKGFRNLLCFK